jgi:hypothetical protein
MKKLLTIAMFFLFVGMSTYALALTIKTPHANETIRYGMSYNLSWDTTGTYAKTIQFYYSPNQNGPWTQLLLTKGTKEFKDSTKNFAAIGNVNASFPNVPTLWLKMQLKNDSTVNTVVGPISIKVPQAAIVDSVITGPVTSNLRLSSTKIYGLKGVVFVRAGATITIDPGTIIFGEVGNTSCLCINRGAKIMAQGTAQKPIIFTSGVVAGQRDRGDWGGLLIMGKAPVNTIETPIEGGIADDATKKIDGWYGGTDPHDNSGVLSYVRVEFGGIAVTPDNELNGLTFGAVGDGTTVDHVQVSYAGDDSFEWFGGTVNCKYLVAYNGIDDDFDTDNGFSGKCQFGLGKRTPQIADISNSEAFESDNDANASENQPFTKVVFCNYTVLGGVQDTSWTSGLGANQYHPRFLTAAQIRRNSRMSLVNSLIVGWPAGIEMTNNNTVRAAGADSIYVRYNNFYGIKKDKFFYFGSGTTPAGTVDANWLSQASYGNVFKNGTGKVDQLAGITDGFSVTNAAFNPLPTAGATYLTTAKFDIPVLTDAYFDKVAYRGAFGTTRWDMPWAEYEPVNKDYKAGTDVNDEITIDGLNIKITPVPANDYINVNYSLFNNEIVSLRIVDITGTVVSSLLNNVSQVSGYYSFNFTTNNINSGVYFLQIQTSNKIQSKIISIIK